MSAPALSVVVPCYQEQENIAVLHARLTQVCAAAVGEAYELVLVNDGSTDLTWPLIQQLAARDPRVAGVDLSRNHGHQLALSAGLSVARGERVLIIDADLQDPPELLPRMLALMTPGVDVVYGQRTDRAGESWFKRTSASVFYRVLNALSDTPIPRDTGDFRLISRRVLDLLNAMPEQGRFLRGMVGWTGFTQVALPYARAARMAGESKYPLHRMVLFSMDAITAFSIRPLRIAAWLGGAFGSIGLLTLLYTLYSWVAGLAVAGWTSLMSVVLIMGSAQLLVLGIIGEYLGRLVVESKRRPLFIIREVLRGADGAG